MKRFIIPFICIALILYTTFNADKISDFITTKIGSNPTLIINKANEYKKNEGFAYVQITEDFIPYSYNDLINILYTVINNGWESFTFYCPAEYTSCIEDFQKLSDDDLTLTHINNFVHPFNSFIDLNAAIYTSGQITIDITYLYTEKQINAVNTEINRLINLLVKSDNTTYENIKIFHDYIINITKYDQTEKKDNERYLPSDLAYGTLFDHLGRCNGYTDTMAIFLSKLGIKNYKITTTQEDISYESSGHVWNAVYLDGKWLHLDLTWDDPVVIGGEDYLHHKYFLVSTEEMAEADAGKVEIEEHNFRKSIYLEFK